MTIKHNLPWCLGLVEKSDPCPEERGDRDVKCSRLGIQGPYPVKGSLLGKLQWGSFPQSASCFLTAFLFLAYFHLKGDLDGF